MYASAEHNCNERGRMSCMAKNTALVNVQVDVQKDNKRNKSIPVVHSCTTSFMDVMRVHLFACTPAMPPCRGASTLALVVVVVVVASIIAIKGVIE